MQRDHTRFIINLVYYVVIGFLLARVIISWIPALHSNMIAGLVYSVTEPVLGPLRSIIPPVGNLDLSIFILWFGLSFVHKKLLYHFR